MTGRPDVVVLGGGIAGLTVALAAADRGLRIMLIDESRPGSASRASAGMLAPTVEGLPTDVLPAAVAARDLYPAFLRDLFARTEVEVPLDRRGIVELASTEAELAAMAERAPMSSERLDPRSLVSLEPAFAAQAGGYLHPTDGSVDNVTLMVALDVAVARHPRITRVSDEVVSLEGRGAVCAFRGRGGTSYEGGALVLAGGAWASALPGLPRELPVRPLRGQLLRLDGLPIRHVTYAAGGYLVPRAASLVVGATSEDVGFEHRTTASGLAALRAIAASAIPVLSHATALDHWSGFRPVTPDGLPILDREPEGGALHYACGYSRNGILLAPWAAGQMAEQLCTGRAPAALAPFARSRFGRAG